LPADAVARERYAEIIQFKKKFFKLTRVKVLSNDKSEHLQIKHTTYAHEFIIWKHWGGRDNSVPDLASDPCAKEVFRYLEILHCDGKNKDGRPLTNEQAREYAKHLIVTPTVFEEFIEVYFVPHRRRYDSRPFDSRPSSRP